MFELSHILRINIVRRIYLKSLVTERKTEFEKLCEFAETQTEYLTAPASSRFHLCNEGGLLEHSLNVAETMLKMKNTLCPEISDESCVVTALFHDLGKVGMPDNPMYVKNIGKNGKEPSICFGRTIPNRHDECEPFHRIAVEYLRRPARFPIAA